MIDSSIFNGLIRKIISLHRAVGTGGTGAGASSIFGKRCRDVVMISKLEGLGSLGHLTCLKNRGVHPCFVYNYPKIGGPQAPGSLGATSLRSSKKVKICSAQMVCAIPIFGTFLRPCETSMTLFLSATCSAEALQGRV